MDTAARISVVIAMIANRSMSFKKNKSQQLKKTMKDFQRRKEPPENTTAGEKKCLNALAAMEPVVQITDAIAGPVNGLMIRNLVSAL